VKNTTVRRVSGQILYDNLHDVTQAQEPSCWPDVCKSWVLLVNGTRGWLVAVKSKPEVQ
jgi:hypothetical protein